MEKIDPKMTALVETIPATLPEMSERATDILILYYKSHMSMLQIAAIFSMQLGEVEQVISNFAEQFSSKEYLMSVVNCLVKMKTNRSKQAQKNAATPSEKDNEIAALKKQLSEAQIKAEAYLEMIKLAEQLYGIPIQKKAGAK
jgi:hypothetical protein